jgi:hypothetical protein
MKFDILSYQGTDAFMLRMKQAISLYEGENVEIFSFDDEEIRKQKYMSMNACKIFNITTKNIYKVYVSFLQTMIDKLVVKDLKDKLLRIKYYNCIVNRDMGQILLKMNFNKIDDLYVDLNLRVDMMNVDEPFSECAILDSYSTLINSSIEQLLSKEDIDYSQDVSLHAMALNYECMIKSCMAIMSEVEYQLFRQSFFDKIKCLMTCKNEGLVEDIADIANNRVSYREKVRKLSIKPLKYD